MDEQTEELTKLGSEGYELLGISTNNARREKYYPSEKCGISGHSRYGRKGAWNHKTTLNSCSAHTLQVYAVLAVFVNPVSGDTVVFKKDLVDLRELHTDVLERILAKDFKELVDIMDNDALKTELNAFITEAILLSAK